MTLAERKQRVKDRKLLTLLTKHENSDIIGLQYRDLFDIVNNTVRVLLRHDSGIPIQNTLYESMFYIPVWVTRDENFKVWCSEITIPFDIFKQLDN